MEHRFSTRSPVDGQVYVERPYASDTDVDLVLSRAVEAQRRASALSVEQRMAFCTALTDAMLAQRDTLAEQLTWQMGRPARHSPLEMRGFEERARRMIELAPAALADIRPPSRAGSERFIRREPLGVVLVLAPWNYPYLTSVNAVIPALLAGNAVVIKHSEQTPLCAEQYVAAAEAAGVPAGLVQCLHLTHEAVARVIGDGRVAHVAFTGSVEGGRAVASAAAPHFVTTGLELGGKDPAYVCADADVVYSVEQLVDGAFFNSGQSCCGIERIYLHHSVYDDFVERCVELTKAYILDDPRKPETNLGPMARVEGAARVREQVRQAVAQGARALIDENLFPASQSGSPYLAPQVLVGVDHDMAVMQLETFGPVVGLMKVQDDEEAVRLMNDSRYGLTASLWTMDLDRARMLGGQLQTGTVFANRCDYLDPDLAWTGVKDSGRGCTLSALGYEHLTRPKSFGLYTRQPT